MADTRETNKSQSFQKQEENGYIREQIVKNKQKPMHILIHACIWVVMALVIGCAIGGSYAVVNHCLNQGEGETAPSHTLSYNDETSSSSDENISQDETSNDEESTSMEESEIQIGDSFVSKEWLDAYLETREYTINDVEAMEDALKRVYQTIQKSMITIRVSELSKEHDSVSNDVINISGIVVSVTESEVILLVDGNLFGDEVVLTAYPDTFKERTVQVRQRDEVTGITALAMSLENFSESDYKQVKAVTFGDSKRMGIGQMVLLVGNPSGFMGSVQYGYVSYIEKNVSIVDGENSILWTDCVRTKNSSGAMFNIYGELVGWLNTSFENNQDEDTLQSAIGIFDLKNVIEDVISGKNSAYLGVKGCNVTEPLMSQYGLPKGIYITEVEKNSVAYQSGIQLGDVITKINGMVVSNVQSLKTILDSLKEQSEVRIVIQRKGKDGYKERVITLILQGR